MYTLWLNNNLYSSEHIIIIIILVNVSFLFVCFLSRKIRGYRRPPNVMGSLNVRCRKSGSLKLVLVIGQGKKLLCYHLNMLSEWLQLKSLDWILWKRSSTRRSVSRRRNFLELKRN